MVFEHDLFCNIWKDGIYLFQQIHIFFGQKIKDGFYQKMRGNMVFSVLYMRRRYKHDIAPPPAGRETKMPLTRKNSPKGDISGITEEDDIHPRK